jgi:hypothetical protein
VALLALRLSACIPLPGGHQPTSKLVAAKEGSNTLVASDHMRCSVSDAAFAQVRAGSSHMCAWRSP